MTPMKIDDLISATFKEGGRGPQHYDCFGLFAELCRRRGMSLPEYPGAGLSAQPVLEVEIAQGIDDCGWRQIDAPQPGCCVLIRNGRYATHIGMVLDCGLRFIHASEGSGITVTRLDDLRWVQRIVGFYSYE